MTRTELYAAILHKKSFLCIGLDTDIEKVPAHLQQNTVAETLFEFNKQIIDATHDLCVAYKLNTAFYEAHGIEGWKAFEKTIQYIPKGIFIIADAKRGDIGNTSDMYAKAFFKAFPTDAITVAPYMGEDSVKPFLQHKDKWAIVLALTSNKGSDDFQMLTDAEGMKLYEHVLYRTATWGTPDNLMFVVGATKADAFIEIRKIVPDHFLLVPGVGAQGGSLKEVCTYGLNKQCGLLINSSRQIIYASNNTDFAHAARQAALSVQTEMAELLSKS